MESIDRSLKPNLKTFPRILAVAATPSGKDIESQICDLKNIWSHLLLTYGLKDECLQRFLSHHTKQTAGQLPQCKLVVVRKLPEELQMMAEKRYLNHHFIRFVSDRGVVVDPAREPDEYPEMHQLVVDFGRSLCEQYPLIFRDLYLYHARDNRDAISEMQRRQNLKGEHCVPNKVTPLTPGSAGAYVLVGGTVKSEYFTKQEPGVTQYKRYGLASRSADLINKIKYVSEHTRLS